MKKIILSLSCIFLIVGLSVHAALPKQNVAGKVSQISGSVIAVQNAQVRPLNVNDDILIGDILSTGPASGLKITMIDEGTFQLGSETSFVVIDYTFGQGNESNAVLDLLKGAVDGVSGQIAKVDTGPGMVIDTQLATIGIRGTQFFIGELDDTLQVAHWSGGGVEVKNPAGSTFIEKDNHGVSIPSIDQAPSASIPWDGEKKERAKALFRN